MAWYVCVLYDISHEVYSFSKSAHMAVGHEEYPWFIQRT